MKYLSDSNFDKNELQNVVLHPLSSHPDSPKQGQLYYNSVDEVFYYYDGTKWESLATQSASGTRVTLKTWTSEDIPQEVV